MNDSKKMYKVIAPLEKRGGGGTYWMRLGTAFTNRDDSINLYLDALPPTNPKSNRYEMQIRELTEEDRRRSDAWRSNTGSASSSGAYASAARDFGGVGGGPSVSSRAVTATAAGEDVPF